MNESCETKDCSGFLTLASLDKKFALFVCSICNRPYVYRRVIK